jgi:cytochrome c551
VRAAVFAAAVLVLAGCGGAGASEQSKLDGKTLFVQFCGSCHSLADAGTKGTYGADLEGKRLTKAQILQVVDDGKGTMPADIVGGADAATVSAYLARVLDR